LELSIFIW